MINEMVDLKFKTESKDEDKYIRIVFNTKNTCKNYIVTITNNFTGKNIKLSYTCFELTDEQLKIIKDSLNKMDWL